MGKAPAVDHPSIWQYLFRTGPAFDREAYIDQELERAKFAARNIRAGFEAHSSPTPDAYLELIGRMGRSVVPLLVEALDDPEESIRIAAAEALLKIGSGT